MDDRGVYSLPGGQPFISGIHVEGTPPEMQLSGRLGDYLVITGQNLAVGDVTVRFRNSRQADPIALAPGPGGTDSMIRARLPDPADLPGAMSEWMPGAHTVSLRVTHSSIPPWETNGIPFAIAPSIVLAEKTYPHGDITLGVQCTPRIRDGQRVTLLFGDRQLENPDITQPPDSTEPTEISFVIPGVEAGTYVVRLRVDGIDSIPIPPVEPGKPLGAEFDPEQKVTVT